MAECSIDVRIGPCEPSPKDPPHSIDLHLEMHQEKLSKINAELCSLLNKTTTPLVVVEFPDKQQHWMDLFDLGKMEQGSLVHQNRLLLFASSKDKDFVKLCRNLERQFGKVGKLKNSCSLKVGLAEGQGKGVAVLDGARIRGSVHTDPQLTGVLVEIIRRVSNEFLQSPPMALLELLQAMTLKCELQKTECFPEELKAAIAGLLCFKDYLQPSQSQRLGQAKGEIIIHLTLPKLLSLRIKGEAAALSRLLYAFV